MILWLFDFSVFLPMNTSGKAVYLLEALRSCWALGPRHPVRHPNHCFRLIMVEYSSFISGNNSKVHMEIYVPPPICNSDFKFTAFLLCNVISILRLLSRKSSRPSSVFRRTCLPAARARPGRRRRKRIAAIAALRRAFVFALWLSKINELVFLLKCFVYSGKFKM